MNKKSNIIIRLELISRDKSSLGNISEVLCLLPKPSYYELIGETKILEDGRVFPKPNSKTLINFTDSYKEYNLENCNENYFNFWVKYYDNLKQISTVFGYEIILNYEFIINDFDYPSIVFKKKIINFISSLNIEFSFSFYNN